MMEIPNKNGAIRINLLEQPGVQFAKPGDKRRLEIGKLHVVLEENTERVGASTYLNTCTERANRSRSSVCYLGSQLRFFRMSEGMMNELSV